MKKVLLVSVTLLLAAVFVMGGIPILATNNAPENPDGTPGDVGYIPDGLDAETALLIKQAVVNYHNERGAVITVDSVVIRKYYGTYNGCVAAMIDGVMMYITIPTVDIVGGIGLTYPTAQKIEAYKDGKLYSLQEAFELGFLSVDDIKQIAEIQNSRHTQQ